MYCYLINGSWKSDKNNQPDDINSDHINQLPLYFQSEITNLFS